MTTHPPARRRDTTRTIVRAAFALAVILFTLHTLGRIQAAAPEAPLLALAAAAVLAGIFAALERRR